ncbi:zf-HC2 domain-containing protein [Mycolicibacterium farcinogenes]|nr:zf-HC2 domain-containing protein [Mycolicibacterium farcinogenes]
MPSGKLGIYLPLGVRVDVHIARAIRNNEAVDCAVAREALSARLDGEREPVPSARVDEHLRDCGECAAWYDRARALNLQLRNLADGALIGAVSTRETRPTRPLSGPARWLGRHFLTIAIVAVGLAQVVLAAAQAVGVNFGMVAGTSWIGQRGSPAERVHGMVGGAGHRDGRHGLPPPDRAGPGLCAGGLLRIPGLLRGGGRARRAGHTAARPESSAGRAGRHRVGLDLTSDPSQ